MADALVSTVSDTARWVAQYRADESARPDAIFRDPLAARLAGEQGRAILASSPRALRSGWSIVARTKLLDDLIATCVADGCDRVVNLACGFDTRPYRLPLPPKFSWFEADLPALIDEKERLLAGETPACALVRARVDLADEGARRAFLARASEGAKRTLVVTEGLLGYLDAAVVSGLGRDLAAVPSLRWWGFDLFSPGALARIKKMRGHRAAPMLGFAPSEGVAFFEALGWRLVEVHSIARAARRFRRLPLPLLPAAWIEPDPRRLGTAVWFGLVRLENVASA